MTASLIAAPMTWQSGVRQTHLLELYSSEGCSSCPPAEARLRALRDDAALWRTVVPVEFHVDYWDGLGWRDPYASSEYTERQQRYANQWHSESVYTPCFVLDGAEDHTPWPALRNLGDAVGVLSVTQDAPQTFVATFKPSIALHGAPLRFYAAFLGSNLQSNVGAGENRGTSLQHGFVALTLAQAPMGVVNGNYRSSLKMKLPAGPAGRTVQVAFWVTPIGHLQPLQATGGNFRDQ